MCKILPFSKGRWPAQRVGGVWSEEHRLVELSGIEPLTSSLRTTRSPN